MSAFLEITDLHAKVEDTPILKGVNLTINAGEIHALMGPNGSGKSTLSSVLMGHPSYEVTSGSIRFLGQDLLELEPEERAALGVFLAFQYPVAIPGVTVSSFLKATTEAITGEKINASAFLKKLREDMAFLEVEKAFLNRNMNEGFSGGEKKRMEILQMLTLQPKLAILDETDSGLDIDALREVSKGVNKWASDETGLLVITHYERILTYVKPQFLHVFLDGQIVVSGGPELIQKVEENGYDWVRDKNQVAAVAAGAN